MNMIRIIPQNAVAFGIRGPTKKAVEDAFGQSALTTLASNSVSGMICITSVYPLDLVRGRITTSPGVYKGIFDATKKIIGAEGVGALFKGIRYDNLVASLLDCVALAPVPRTNIHSKPTHPSPSRSDFVFGSLPQPREHLGDSVLRSHLRSLHSSQANVRR